MQKWILNCTLNLIVKSHMTATINAAHNCCENANNCFD